MATVTGADRLPLERPEQIIAVRQVVRQWAIDLGFSLVEQTKMVTAASELARNTVIHGGGGAAHIERIEVDGRIGLRLTFSDKGPGIPDIEAAMTDGYTTSRGLGLGLGGSRRLMNEFEIHSEVGRGTTVTVTRWR